MDDFDSEDDVPTVMVGDRNYPVTEIDNKLIAKMTQQEKDAYITIYQEYYSHYYE
jgi:hypothetical protein